MTKKNLEISISGILMMDPDIIIEVDGIDLTLEELIERAESKKEK